MAAMTPPARSPTSSGLTSTPRSAASTHAAAVMLVRFLLLQRSCSNWRFQSSSGPPPAERDDVILVGQAATNVLGGDDLAAEGTSPALALSQDGANPYLGRVVVRTVTATGGNRRRKVLLMR